MNHLAKRTLALLISVCLLMGLASVANAGPNKWGWDVPAETFEFSVYSGQGDPAEFEKFKTDSNFIMDKFLLDEFNVKINKTVQLDEVAQRVNLMLISGDYPDMMTWLTDQASETFIESGHAIELNDLLSQYGQNILAELGDYIELLKDEDGKIYKLPAGFGFKIDTVGNAFSMRYDWWKELGVDLYRTPDQFYEQLKAVLKNHPANVTGQKVYGITSQDQGVGLMNTILGAWGVKNGYVVDDEGNMTYWLNVPEIANDVAQYANRFYREDMIDPDWLTNTYDTAQEKSVNDRLAGYIGIWWHMFTWGHEYWQEMDPATPLERRFMNVTVTDPDTKAHTLTSATYLPTNAFWVITDNCKDPVSLIKWLNWECSPVGTLITTYGVPDDGNVYNITDNKVVMREASLDAKNKNVEFHQLGESYGKQTYWLATRQSALSKGKVPFPYELDPRVAETMGGYDMYVRKLDGTGYLDPGWDICWGFYDDSTIWDATLFSVKFPADEPISIIKQNADEIIKAEWVKIVSAESPEACLAAVEAARSALNGACMQQLEKYRTDAYKANLEKMAKGN